MDRIYLDNAATTAVSQPVMEAMLPYYMQVYGNPSSIHSTGRDAKKAVERARRQVASALGCSAQEIYFTAGGSESDNWALKGAAFAHQEKGKHIITTQIEHHAILHTCQWLEAQGAPLRPDDACAMLQPVFEGVAAMHEVGLVHRGICPANIRVLDNGRARLTGYATVGLRTAGSGLHEQLYEGYSAPEQYSTTEFEGRYTDEYSLAAVVYRMVCGQSPVPAAQRLVSDSNPRARTLERAVPEYVSDVLWMGLQLRPAERIQTVPQLFRALSSQEYTTELTQTLQQAAPRPQSTEEEERKKHILSLRNLLAAILILLAILTLLIVWGLVNQGLHTAKPAESTPASEPASSLVTEPVNLAPDFVGMDYDSQVRNNNSYAGDYLFYVTMEYSDTVEKGKIIRQTPEAGEVIEKGSTIDLVVSRGPQMVEMPNVAGFTRDGAEQQLAQVGLNASFYPIYNDGSYVSGCVAYCSEEPGAMVEVGSTIIVYMAAEVEAEVPATPPETTTPSAGTTPSAAQTEPPADGAGTENDTD